MADMTLRRARELSKLATKGGFFVVDTGFKGAVTAVRTGRDWCPICGQTVYANVPVRQAPDVALRAAVVEHLRGGGWYEPCERNTQYEHGFARP